MSPPRRSTTSAPPASRRISSRACHRGHAAIPRQERLGRWSHRRRGCVRLRRRCRSSPESRLARSGRISRRRIAARDRGYRARRAPADRGRRPRDNATGGGELLCERRVDPGGCRDEDAVVRRLRG
jgi:hypothetical protein